MELSKSSTIVCKSKIAILMATYNGEAYLKEQINSILNQSYDDWELYIHDDGSKDKTLYIIDEYEKKYPDKIHIVNGKSTGSAKKNFFYLINLIEADYIMFSDQDDYWYRDKIKVTLEKMKSVQENNCQLPILVHTDLEIVDSDLNTISFSIGKYQGFKFEQESINRLLVGNTVTGCTVMINKILLHMTKGLNDTSKIIMHDWWLALLASEYGKIDFIDEPTIKYRQHTDNTVGAVRYDKRYIIDRILHSSEIRKDLAKTRIQARYMADVFSIDKNDIVYKYAHIFSAKKIKRVCFYVKNGIKKSGIKRNLGLYLFG